MKLNKYSVISMPLVYITLSYSLFAIKYTSPVEASANKAYIDKIINSLGHLWYIKIIISVGFAMLINFITNWRKNEKIL